MFDESGACIHGRVLFFSAMAAGVPANSWVIFGGGAVRCSLVFVLFLFYLNI